MLAGKEMEEYSLLEKGWFSGGYLIIISINRKADSSSQCCKGFCRDSISISMVRLSMTVLNELSSVIIDSKILSMTFLKSPCFQYTPQNILLRFTIKFSVPILMLVHVFT